MNEEQLKLFDDEELPRLNDTEEALLHYMQKCMTLEEELKEVKEKIKALQAEGVEEVFIHNTADSAGTVTINAEDGWDNSWSPNDMITIQIAEKE